jgi:hypothetical protein
MIFNLENTLNFLIYRGIYVASKKYGRKNNLFDQDPPMAMPAVIS